MARPYPRLRLRCKRAASLAVPALTWLAAACAAPAAAAPTTALPADVPREERPTFRRAVAIAERSPVLRTERERRPALRPRTYAERTGDRLDVYYEDGGEDRAVVRIDPRRGRVLEAWTGIRVSWEMARGYEGDFGRAFNSPWVLVPLGLLFLAPFVDPRRPLRLLHLDLLVLLAFGVSHIYFNRGEVETSVPLVYPVLGYLLVRMLIAGFRPRAPRDGPLLPYVRPSWLVLGLVGLVAFRIVLNVVDSNVIDVGVAGAIGADHVQHGRELYDGGFADDPPNADTYGPANYLAYVPFELVLPWDGVWRSVPAAHAAAIAFDLLTMLGLLLVGRRLRPGGEGRALGTALAFAWAAYPYSLFALSVNSNDSLIAAIVVFALLALASAPARGALIGAGGAAKFAPLALAPLFASGRGDERPRGYLLYAGVLVLVVAATVLPFLPDGGLREAYDRTLGFQLGRESPFSVWGQEPSLDALQTAAKVVAVNLAAVLLVVPARRSVAQVAALGAAVLIAVQIPTEHWFYLYVVWFAPFVLVAVTSECRRVSDLTYAAASRN